MDSPRHEERHAAEAGPGERLTGEPQVAAVVREPTARELELQRRLVRESLLLRPA